jgi:hypothetical protein
MRSSFSLKERECQLTLSFFGPRSLKRSGEKRSVTFLEYAILLPLVVAYNSTYYSAGNG